MPMTFLFILLPPIYVVIRQISLVISLLGSLTYFFTFFAFQCLIRHFCRHLSIVSGLWLLVPVTYPSSSIALKSASRPLHRSGFPVLFLLSGGLPAHQVRMDRCRQRTTLKSSSRSPDTTSAEISISPPLKLWLTTWYWGWSAMYPEIPGLSEQSNPASDCPES